MPRGPIWSRLGQTTQTISAASGLTPGSGNVELYQFDPTNNYAMLDETLAETAYNAGPAAVPSGTFVALVREPISGQDFIVPVAGGTGVPSSTPVTAPTWSSGQNNYTPPDNAGTLYISASTAISLTGISIAPGRRASVGEVLAEASEPVTLPLESRAAPPTHSMSAPLAAEDWFMRPVWSCATVVQLPEPGLNCSIASTGGVAELVELELPPSPPAR